jgi:hypothetical protein
MAGYRMLVGFSFSKRSWELILFAARAWLLSYRVGGDIYVCVHVHMQMCML